jgi:hypothetical protein
MFSLNPEEGPSIALDVPSETWAARAEEVKQAFHQKFVQYIANKRYRKAKICYSFWSGK